MKRALLIVVVAALAQAGEGCIQVDSLRVTAADIAVSVPAFEALPPATMLGYAPTPGLSRWWRSTELSSLAARNGLAAGSLPDFCVQRPTRTLTLEEVEAALREALPADAKLEIVEICHSHMPNGKLEFNLRSLQRASVPASNAPAANPPLLWRGRVVYDGARSAAFWATVRVSRPHTGLYAAREIPRGRVLDAGDIREETRQTSLFEPESVAAAGDAIGREARYTIRAGLPIAPQALTSPREVESGEIVKVQVESGQAQLKFNGRAMNAGRLGELVYVENLENGRRFRARVDGPKQVSVQVEDQNAQADQSVDRRPLAGTAGNQRAAGRGQTQENGRTLAAGSLH